MAVHVRYKSLYISLPSSANNNVKWLNCAYFGKRETFVNFSYLHLEFNAWISSESNRRTEQIYTAAKFQGKMYSFFREVVPGVTAVIV